MVKISRQHAGTKRELPHSVANWNWRREGRTEIHAEPRNPVIRD